MTKLLGTIPSLLFRFFVGSMQAPSQTKMVDSSSDAESTPSHHPRKRRNLLQIFSSIRGGGTCEIKITSEGQAVGIKWQWPLDKPLEWNKYGSKMDTGQHLKLFKLLIAASDNPKFRTVRYTYLVNNLKLEAPSQTKMVDSSSDAESTPSHHPRKRRNVSFEEAVRTDQTKEVPPPTPNHEASRETETQEHQDQDPTKFLHSPKLLRALSSKNKPKSAGKLTPEQQEQQKQKVLKDLEWKQRQKPKVLEVLDLEDTRLENLEIFADAKMRLRSGEVQLTKQKEGKLRKLKVDGLNPNTIKSLLKTNANSIEHLHVLVETPDNRPYFQDSRKRKAEKIYIACVESTASDADADPVPRGPGHPRAQAAPRGMEAKGEALHLVPELRDRVRVPAARK
ncbi:hypothetical protein FOCC_FOCC001913 [Frankliniella occidentalis]|nr:hypothetical protein FOCC_FOCC001913 [Frankliniella occidentalis]